MLLVTSLLVYIYCLVTESPGSVKYDNSAQVSFDIELLGFIDDRHIFLWLTVIN